MYCSARCRRLLARPSARIQRAPSSVIVLVRHRPGPGFRNNPTRHLPDLPGIFETVGNFEHEHAWNPSVHPASRRTPEYLKQSFAAARAEGYALGVKLVRGAYHPHELAAHAPSAATTASPAGSSEVEGFGDAQGLSISPDPEPPVWLTKAETDACYDACAALLLEEVRKDVARAAVPSVGVLFGTHNWKSVDGVLQGMEKLGMARRIEGAEGPLFVPDEVAERIAIGQLYGA